MAERVVETWFISIHPGLPVTGAAVFHGNSLIRIFEVVSHDEPKVSGAFREILDQMEAIVERHGEVREVVCPRISNMNGVHFTRDVRTLVKHITRWATVGPHHFIWTAYTQKDIFSASVGMEVSSFTNYPTAMECLKAAIVMNHDCEFELSPNSLLALAAGLCHVGEMEKWE